jgi:hypothetical protein
MHTKFYACLMLIALGALPAVCRADDASHRKAAEGLLVTIEAEKRMQEHAERLLETLIKQNPQLASQRDVVQTFITKYLHWPSLKADMITLYAQEFTEAELKQLTAFYRTPVGHKSLAAMPKLALAGTQLGITRLQANRAELQRMLEADPGKPQ